MSLGTIFTELPNNLIMDIIKLADGGLNTHKKKFSNSLNIIKTQSSSVEPSNRTCREGKLFDNEFGNPFDGYFSFWEHNKHYPVDSIFRVWDNM